MKIKNTSLVKILALTSIWLVLFIIDQATESNSQGILTSFYIVGVIQILLLIQISQKKDKTTINGMIIFLTCSLLFIYTIPYFSTYITYSYIITKYESQGIKNLIQINYWSTLAFFIGYTLVSPKIKKDTFSAREDVKYDILIILLSFVGLLSFILVYASFSVNTSSYEEIGSALQGQGWLIRSAELLGVSGLLAIIVGKKSKRKWLIRYGWAAIILFGVLRYPFLNRENVIKFFIIAILALQILEQKKIKTTYIFSGFIFFITILLIFPFLSSMRGGMDIINIQDYIHFFIRDLNFAEIASSLLAHSDYNSRIGIYEGLTNTFGMLIPREIWTDKGYTVSVTITSWLTPVYYDIDNPLFAYAPTYIGFSYVLGGYSFILVVALLLGIITSYFSRQHKNSIKITLSSIIIYYLTFSAHKLDFGNIITAMIIPVAILIFSNLLIKALK